MQSNQNIIEHLAGIYKLSDCSDPLHRATHLPHAYATLRCARLFYGGQLPDSLAVAAFAHDRDRIFQADARTINSSADLRSYKAHKDASAEKSAELLRADLKGMLPEKLINDIAFLVERHERGGDRKNWRLIFVPDSSGIYNLNYGADVIREADALSFFNGVFDLYTHYRGPEETRRKIQFSFERLSKKGRRIFAAQDPVLFERIGAMVK